MRPVRTALLACCLLLAALPLHGQGGARRANVLRVPSEALARGRHVVVVDLDANRLYFTRGTRVLWSAPVGTGTGFRLDSGRGSWDFATPRGAFQVVYKEREPDWIAPDWWFVERGMRVPPADHPSRRHTRGLGAAAVFIGRGLAIHGTDKPHLLGQRVSHGCIRLSDADALRLYHNVQVGTEVVIVSRGEELEEPAAAQSRSATPARAAGTLPPRDPVIVELEGEDSPTLLAWLEEAMQADPSGEQRPRWTDIASVLLLRGSLQKDAEALEGLYSLAPRLADGRLRDEYATFLADAFVQAPIDALSTLGAMDRQTRVEVATLLAETTVALFPGENGHPQLPWPTRRVPREALGTYGRRAWDALAAAEAGLRPGAELATRGR